MWRPPGLGTIAAGAYGQSILGGVMGDFLGATICVLELSIYLALAADASRFDASAVSYTHLTLPTKA